ncbi:UbiA prenyltransferase family protein [Candidatus Woesearchaeota archaeon]|nr:UbiA prenyltransferase family protein [Candidatus Woesearchaeota archaeon]
MAKIQVKIKEYIKLLRPWQYYKNSVIFLPLIFGGLLFDVDAFFKVLLGFLTLSIISSANYIFNDILDLKADRLNPEKKNRPLATKKISTTNAAILAATLGFSGLIIAFFLSFNFFIVSLLLVTLTTVYSVWLKKEMFADILIIATNFVLRTLSGAYVISVAVSHWLILVPFFLALFLATGKRESELKFLGKKALQHKKVLEYYTPELTSALTIISTTLVIISYSLYIFFSAHRWLFITLPGALYLVFRYLNLIKTGDKKSRNTHLVFFDSRILLVSIATSIIALWAIYLV